MNSIHPIAAVLSTEEMEMSIQQSKKQGLRFVGKILAGPFGAMAVAILLTPSIWESAGPITIELSLCFVILATLPFLPLQRRP